jgi:hypothetical protein
MNSIENLNRKENGIIFDYVTVPDYHAASNLALWNASNPNYLRSFTHAGIEIHKVDPAAKIRELRKLMFSLNDTEFNKLASEYGLTLRVENIGGVTVRVLYAAEG